VADGAPVQGWKMQGHLRPSLRAGTTSLLHPTVVAITSLREGR
jgi:hypothetical protein